MPETPGVPGDVPALRAEIARLRGASERLRMLNEDKDAVIAQLRVRNTELEERVARLERLVSRNSGNSSMPPSADDLPGKKPPRREGRKDGGTKRKPGKQPGAPGAYLAWNEDPDKTENCSLRGPASAALTSPAPVTWVHGFPTRSPTCLRRGR